MARSRRSRVRRAAMLVANHLLVQLLRRPKKRRRTCWVHKSIAHRERVGIHTELLPDLLDYDQARYINFLRMNETSFQWLLAQVGPRIQRQDTAMRAAIPASLKLATTLRFLKQQCFFPQTTGVLEKLSFFSCYVFFSIQYFFMTS